MESTTATTAATAFPPPPPELARLGFTTTDTTLRPRLIVGLSALPRGGKTHFGLFAPSPVAFFDFDLGSDGVRQQAAADGRVIWHMPFRQALPPMAVDPTQANLALADAAGKLWALMYQAWMTALAHPAPRTLFIDNVAILEHLFFLQKFGKTQEIPPLQRGRANEEFAAFLMLGEQSNKNVVLATRLVDEWANDGTGKSAPTGRLRSKGPKELKYLTDANLTVAKYGGWLRVDDCRKTKALDGVVFPNEHWPQPLTFAGLGRIVYPGTTAADWK